MSLLSKLCLSRVLGFKLKKKSQDKNQVFTMLKYHFLAFLYSEYYFHMNFITHIQKELISVIGTSIFHISPQKQVFGKEKLPLVSACGYDSTSASILCPKRCPAESECSLYAGCISVTFMRRIFFTVIQPFGGTYNSTKTTKVTTGRCHSPPSVL